MLTTLHIASFVISVACLIGMALVVTGRITDQDIRKFFRK